MTPDLGRTADRVLGLARAGETLALSFRGERSDFVRFNRSRVRQAGRVEETRLAIDLAAGLRHVIGTTTLSGDESADDARAASLVDRLRERLPSVPEDPFFVRPPVGPPTERVVAGRLPDPDTVVDAVSAAGRDRDLVGCLASGEIFASFAASAGQRHAYRSASFQLEWSFYDREDKAVQASYAGVEWSDAELARRAAEAAADLALLRRPARRIPPGAYRVHLAPRALAEVFGVLSWGGFSLRAERTRTTPLLRMIEGGAALHPAVTIVENVAEGLAPGFQENGFLRPDRVTLVEQGRHRTSLVSPRSAAEYSVQSNGASADEAPTSLDVAPGELGTDEVLRRLDTGVALSNLHYLNYSDRAACRMTGLTRFATFWVERGERVGPLDVMRFDDTLYRLLGSNLLGLTREREWLLDAENYAGRRTSSVRLPGALVEDFRFTL